MVRTKEIISLFLRSELPEQIQHPATAEKCESVVPVQRVLPYPSDEVVVKYEQTAADIRAERYQRKQKRSSFGGLPRINLYDYWDIYDGEQE